jgi:hypothetical protein
LLLLYLSFLIVFIFYKKEFTIGKFVFIFIFLISFIK